MDCSTLFTINSFNINTFLTHGIAEVRLLRYSFYGIKILLLCRLGDDPIRTNIIVSRKILFARH